MQDKAIIIIALVTSRLVWIPISIANRLAAGPDPVLPFQVETDSCAIAQIWNMLLQPSLLGHVVNGHLKVPQKQPKRGRLWLTDGSCVRLRPCWPNHVWSYDFVMARTHDGKAFRMLTIIDEYTLECLAIEVSRRLDADAVLYRLTELFVSRRPPDYIRSDMTCPH